MFNVCCWSTFKKAQETVRNSVTFHGNATQTVFSIIVALHSPHLFLSTNKSLQQIFHPKPISLLFSFFYVFFCFLLNHSQALCPPSTSPHSSVYPPQTALASSGGLYCLHGCAVNIWSALLHEPCCVSTPLCSLLNCSPPALNCMWLDEHLKLLDKHLCFYCPSNLTEQVWWNLKMFPVLFK